MTLNELNLISNLIYIIRMDWFDWSLGQTILRTFKLNWWQLPLILNVKQVFALLPFISRISCEDQSCEIMSSRIRAITHKRDKRQLNVHWCPHCPHCPQSPVVSPLTARHAGHIWRWWNNTQRSVLSLIHEQYFQQVDSTKNLEACPGVLNNCLPILGLSTKIF